MDKKEKCEPPIKYPIKPPGPPKVWSIVEIKLKNAEAPIRFTIQEIPEDRYEEAVEHMCKYFIADEPMCKCMTFTEDPNGGKPIMAGLNVLTLSFKDEKFNLDDMKSKKGRIVFEAVLDLNKEVNVFEKYGIDKYMTAFGLSVHPSYRGAALGSHLLNARVNIGREYNIPVTITAFTSPISQKLAERCGFETLIEKNYDEYVDEKGNLQFPGITAKSVKLMGKRLL
ncbi:uncharacterized protein LOC122531612 isoform X2 [Frieseomelitta varia]|uniref:uncharacterized protein LOC122531612 isoform X2 n=1 Tax=Frieseomelitta varia TaxID=561572 RepID=UPI001CB695A0|nr:uncharacterized protein LOC122531612 isoform X2 [Frieseomelitta varia]